MTEWNEQISDALAKKWRKCIDALQGLEQVSLPRRRVPTNTNNYEHEVYAFSDSSKDIADGARIYPP